MIGILRKENSIWKSGDFLLAATEAGASAELRRGGASYGEHGYGFNGEIASGKVRNKYINKSISHINKKAESAIRYNI